MDTAQKQLNRSDVFYRMCYIRHFEGYVAQAYQKGLVPGVIYLATGQESIASTMATLTEGFHIFNQHRCHAIYLAHGGDPERLRDELLGYDTGCCAGRGGSPSAQDARVPMFPYHGLIGEQIPLATGYALATSTPTLVYFGDAGAEEDYAMTAFGFAATHRLPMLFVCEDNDLSILTPVHERRHWDVTRVVRSMGLACREVEDDPEQIHAATQELLAQLPAYIHIKTCRHMWHSGVGVDGQPVRDRLELFRSQVDQADRLEAEAKEAVRQLWEGCLDRIGNDAICSVG